MIFRKSSFLLIFLLPDATQKSILNVFDTLTKVLGLELFRSLFQVILTDNGVEFKDPESLEFTSNGFPRTRLFYCDPQASWQKPHIENSHRLIRRILPKGTSFNSLSRQDTLLMMRHINSVFRDLLDARTPFEMMKSEQEIKLLNLLEGCTVDPLVDSLRSCEAKYSLHVLYGKAGSDPHPVDVLTGRNNVDVRNSYHVAPPCPAIVFRNSKSFCLLHF